jgi:hypothetical protein
VALRRGDRRHSATRSPVDRLRGEGAALTR